ncbi:MAG: hypothetical protein KME32_22255 [Mojavia pulchra JT2-VF2]|jgi:hypothetical protein|uniref:Uncharacterized protein n=1 Tax=Mojavia pulchra JT2-VF2 TaxID=287848 RepID=A0A951Q1Z9_9NOST|nr:hypothetical protein [Mojavia pulchra JT2-VF2]
MSYQILPCCVPVDQGSSIHVCLVSARSCFSTQRCLIPYLWNVVQALAEVYYVTIININAFIRAA